MGEHERNGKFPFEGLTSGSGFLSSKTLNVNLQEPCLHWFGANNLIFVQVDAFRHSKCSVPYTYEESYTENVRPGGVAQIA
jgi:hypothetical protein